MVMEVRGRMPSTAPNPKPPFTNPRTPATITAAAAAANLALLARGSSDATYDPHIQTPSLQAVEDVNAIIADHISHDRQRVGSLARLAAAFAPSDQPVDIQRLDRVGVHAIDERHVEIEAVMCDQSDCTSVLVPITFPHECEVSTDDDSSDSESTRRSTESVEACVIENLEELDEQTRTTLDLMEELSSPVLQYPDWWISLQSLGNLELVQEALTIQRLLNEEDFSNDVRNLVCRALGIDANQSYLIDKARVVDIGPVGFCFKAIAAAGTGGKAHVVEASLAFDDGEARIDAGSLRSAVLLAVEETSR